MADRQCVLCNDFVTSDHKLMKRHVAISHGDSTFSTLQCGICKQKYYDFDHFQDHVRETPSCSSDCHMMMKQIKLADHMEKAFHSLVDQMMKPAAQFPAAVSCATAELDIGGIVGESLAQMQPPSQSNSQSSPSSVKEQFTDVKVECTNETPKIISVTSLADQGHFVDQTTTIRNVSLDSSEQMDVQHQEGGDCVDQEKSPENGGATSMFDTQMEGDRKDNGIEEVDAVRSIIEENYVQDQLQRKTSEADLRLHCRQIILKRQQNNRLTCSICKGSIIAISKEGFPHCYNTMEHVRRHASSFLFACNLCDFKSNDSRGMRQHVTGRHSSDQYIDTTADRIDELMQLVTRCFDSGLHAGNSLVASRISDHQQEIANCGTDQAMSNGDSASEAQLSTMVGGLKLPISVPKGTDWRNSNGPKRKKRLFFQPRKSRYSIGRKVQGGFSVNLEKNNLDKPVLSHSAQIPLNVSLSCATADLVIGQTFGESMAQMQPPSSSQSCSSSVKNPFADVKVEGNNETPKIISVRSLADQGPFVDQTTSMQCPPLDSQSADQMDVQHQDAQDSVDEDGLEAFLEREAIVSIETQVHNDEGAINHAIGGNESSSMTQLHPPSRSNSQDPYFTSASFVEVKVEFNKGDSPKLNSVASLEYQGHIAHDASMPAAMDSAKQMDAQHQEGQDSVDHGKLPENGGSTSMFDAQMEGNRMDHEIEDIDAVRSIVEENNGQKEFQSKPSETDLRLHCRKIILKHLHNNRLTCSICKISIIAVDKGFPRSRTILQHIQRHIMSSSLFACNLCDIKSNNREVMRRHVTGKHSSDQYIDTTSDRIDELMQLVTQCFDHGLHAGNSLVVSPISDHQQEIANSETDQAMSNGDCSSSAQPLGVSTMVGGLKLRISVPKGADCPNSNGAKGRKRLFTHLKKSRYTIGRMKQDGFSVTLEKNNHGRSFSAALLNSSLSKLLPEPASHELNCVMQRLELPPHILVQKEIYSKLAQKFIKDGKLECNLCHQLIIVSNHQQMASELVNMENAYQHAMTHVNDVHLFECATCDYGTSNQTAICNHVAHIHNSDQRKIIDHRAKYYPKILQMFLACYTDEKSGHGTEGRRSERTVERKPEGRNPELAPQILKARRACYDRVKDFIKNGKLFCQLCSQWVLVTYSTRDSVGYVMTMAIRHVTTHIEGCHLFECSTCHIVTRTKSSMYFHARKCHKGSPVQFIDRSNQYYREILILFLSCFDVKSSGDKLGTETTTSIAKEHQQGTGVARGGCGKDENGNGRSALEPVDSTQDQVMKSVCSKCGYKTASQMLFHRHQKIMHAAEWTTGSVSSLEIVKLD